MSSQHRDPAMTVRPPAALKAAAETALGDREMRAFVVACLAALVADPDRFLAQLDEHWPEEKPRGRPRRTPGGP
ncbi:hypothetical protein [Streptomyces chrestomyceticus]|uniref:hypothetical protein n=1 Tax=Streptomyces chrestomyceticus TaxID=68185 RepID=UPI0033DF4C92